MIKLRSTLSLIILTGASLLACQKQADGDAPPVDLFGSKPSKPEAKFGTKFEKAYRADPKAQPVDVSDGDLPPRDATAEPVEIN